ncbi:MAG: hypothetical protein Q9195_001773 [Heterodermia aff. obscurata]
MPSEVDPLLPRNEPAPEIVGYGFSRKQNADAHDESPYQYQAHINERSNQERDKESDPEPGTDTSPLRTILTIFTTVVAFGLILSILVSGRLGESPRAPPIVPSKPSNSISDRVERILSEHPLIDGHNDLAILIRFVYHNNIYNTNFTKRFEDGAMLGHVDIPRLNAGKVGGAFWSSFVPCPANGSDFSDGNYAPAVSETLSQLDLLQRLTSKYSDIFSAATPNSTSAAAAFDKHHLLISPFAIEGLHQIGNSFSNLRLYHSLNVKYATLTHNCHNKFADAALVTDSSGKIVAAGPLWGGVSAHGQVLVKEMNRLGLLVDLAHVSKDTMVDVLGGRPGKWKDFISCTPSDSSSGIPEFYPHNSTLHQVARHIMYIGEKIGFDHVGLGSDFDGIPTTPEGLDDVSRFPDLLAELLRLGLTDEDAAKVVGRNVLRVWADVDRVAAKMKKEGVLPAEDSIVLRG